MLPIEKSVYEYVREAVAEKGDMRFLFDEDRTYSFTETLWAAVEAANRLHALGVEEGSLIALRATRSLDTAVLLFAVQFLGACTALVDPHGPLAATLADKDVRPRFLLTNEDHSPDLAANGGWVLTDTVTGARADLPVPCPARETAPAFSTAIDVRKPALIIFTSGSTGSSKGVMLSQYNYMNHIRNYSIAGCYYPDDVSMEVLPIDHVFGLAVIMMGLYCRYQVLFPRSVKVDYVAECVERYGITRLDGVPSYALALAAEKTAKGYAMSSLRTAVMGGAPSSREQFDHMERTLGLDIVPVYGMSECIGITGIPKSESAEKRSSTVGKFLPMCQGAILDEDGTPLPPGQSGEICVKAPAVTLGYYNDPEATAAAIDADGFLHTGDLGYLDEGGYLHISGRKKDIIIRNGANLSSVQIEKKISSLPFVYTAAVVGVPHEKVGEVPCAAVVLKAGVKPDGEALRQALSSVLSKQEMPDRVLCLEALPLLPSGKTDKHKLKELFS